MQEQVSMVDHISPNSSKVMLNSFSNLEQPTSTNSVESQGKSQSNKDITININQGSHQQTYESQYVTTQPQNQNNIVQSQYYNPHQQQSVQHNVVHSQFVNQQPQTSQMKTSQNSDSQQQQYNNISPQQYAMYHSSQFQPMPQIDKNQATQQMSNQQVQSQYIGQPQMYSSIPFQPHFQQQQQVNGGTYESIYYPGPVPQQTNSVMGHSQTQQQQPQTTSIIGNNSQQLGKEQSQISNNSQKSDQNNSDTSPNQSQLQQGQQTPQPSSFLQSPPQYYSPNASNPSSGGQPLYQPYKPSTYGLYPRVYIPESQMQPGQKGGERVQSQMYQQQESVYSASFIPQPNVYSTQYQSTMSMPAPQTTHSNIGQVNVVNNVQSNFSNASIPNMNQQPNNPQDNGSTQIPSSMYSSASSQHSMSMSSSMNKSQSKGAKDYYNKEIENTLIHRSELIGQFSPHCLEFDDYFEKHKDKYFTPELDEFLVFHTPQGDIIGLQIIYRDPWGTTDKETYKGNIQLPKGLKKEQFLCKKLKFTYDDYITEAYVDGIEDVSYIKIVTANKKVLEMGRPVNLEVKNMNVELTRIMGIGGALGTKLNALYFYYS